MTEAWRNRIAGYGEVAAGELMPNPANWRGHPAMQATALGKGLDTVGWVSDVIVNRTTGHLVDGHLRVALALKRGSATMVPVKFVELSAEEEMAVLVTLDPLAAMATTDEAMLLANVRSLDGSEYAGMVAGVAEHLGIYGTGPGKTDPGPQVEKADELCKKWGIELGEQWQLGDHRLICGDCTDAAVVDAVAFGEPFDLWVSDPPYGVSYAEKNKYLNAVAKGNSIQTPIVGDHLTLEQATELWRRAFGMAFDHAKPGCVYYVHAPQGGELMMMMMMMLHENGWLLKPQIIWVKNNHVLGRSDYQLKHEPILYGWKDGARHEWCGSRKKMSVWYVDKPLNSDLHPTTKPLELAENAILNSSLIGQFVFDGFLGSGTTLIACERLGRRCRSVEISPGYVAVALERWATMTGGTPEVIA